MQCKAYFIGGQEDLTKRIIELDKDILKFYKKPKLDFVSIYNLEELVQDAEIIYRLAAITPNGVRIYEYEE